MGDSCACFDLIAGVETDTEIDRSKRQVDVVIQATPAFVLIGSFRFFRPMDIKFRDDALYALHVRVAGMNANVPAADVASSYVTKPTMVQLIGDVDSASVVGPITNLTAHYASLHISGTAFRLPPGSEGQAVPLEDDPNSAFNITVTQWTTVLKNSWKTTSHLPIRAFFPTNGRFQVNKKPIPPNSAIVSVEGRIIAVRYGDDGFPALFLLEIDHFAKLSSGGAGSAHVPDAVPVVAPNTEPTPTRRLKTALPNAVISTSPGKKAGSASDTAPASQASEPAVPPPAPMDIDNHRTVSPPSPCTPCSSESPCASSQTVSSAPAPSRATKRKRL
ncbi:hypothetical protein K523DRAFT_372224 [Schizophyllum commune Tattone D]|nr:hypothetical protein K523DRAFT_372224 [Schizophyllum commune Tattone D]